MDPPSPQEEPLVYLVNISTQALPLYACCLEEGESEVERLCVERLLPGRCCAASRLAVYGDRLWIEVAAGYSGSRATIVEACWLKYDSADVALIAGPEDDEEQRGTERDDNCFYYKAVSHDVGLYSEPRRTAKLVGEVECWECLRCIKRRWDATSNEMWARLDDEGVGEEERWVCISERHVEGGGLALEALKLTGYFINTYARNYDAGQLPLRDRPSLGPGSTRVASLPHWMVARALSVRLVPRRAGEADAEAAAVGTLWVEIAVADSSCWAIHANANTGIVVLEPIEGCTASCEAGKEALFRNVYSKGALQLKSRDDVLSGAATGAHGTSVAAAVSLGACVRVRQMALAPTGELLAECRPVVAPDTAQYAWAIARSRDDGAPTLQRVLETDGEGLANQRLYVVAEDLAVRPAPRESTVARTLARGAATIGDRRIVDQRGEVWIRISDKEEWIAESAGGIQDSATNIETRAVLVSLSAGEVSACREDALAVSPQPAPPAQAQEHHPVDASVLASLDAFAEASRRADDSLRAAAEKRQSRRSTADALRAFVNAAGGRDADDGLLVEDDRLDAPPLLRVVASTKRRTCLFSSPAPPHLLVRVSTNHPKAQVALLVLESPEHTITLDKPLSRADSAAVAAVKEAVRKRPAKTAIFALYENLDYADPAALVIKAAIAPSLDNAGRALASPFAVYRCADKRRATVPTRCSRCLPCVRSSRPKRDNTMPTSTKPVKRNAKRKATYARLPTALDDDDDGTELI